VPDAVGEHPRSVGWWLRLAVAENRRMIITGPLEVYRQFQSFLINGEYGRLAEVADMDGYTEDAGLL
jgi:hypothetical protein